MSELAQEMLCCPAMLVNEKEEEDDEIGILRRLITRLPRTLRYVCECFCELLGSIILSACLVWGVVASLAVFLLVHQYGISKFP